MQSIFLLGRYLLHQFLSHFPENIRLPIYRRFSKQWLIPVIFTLGILSSNRLFGNDLEKQLASENSILSYTPLVFSSFSLSCQFANVPKNPYPGVTGQWWVSPNLALIGSIQPLRKDHDIYLYTNAYLGLVPEWSFYKNTELTLGFGMHRILYKDPNISAGDSGDYRWFHFNLQESFTLKNINVHLNLIHLFDNKWKTDQISFLTSKIIYELVMIQAGGILYDMENFKFAALLKLSVAI